MMAAKRAIINLVSVAILTLGFAQFSVAGVVSSSELINAELRGERISKIETLLAQDDVANQLQQLGVSPDLVAQRVQNMSDAELLELVNGIDNQVAGSDGVAIVGAVFIVLIILELVGVTDIFKSF
jgi:Family of unknown function (DUF6627)